MLKKCPSQINTFHQVVIFFCKKWLFSCGISILLFQQYTFLSRHFFPEMKLTCVDIGTKYRFFLFVGEWGSPPQPAKNLLIHLEKFLPSYPSTLPPSPQKFYFPPVNNNFQVINHNKNFVFSCSHCSCTIFFNSRFLVHINFPPAKFPIPHHWGILPIP